MKRGIYKITNLVNGKFYIGSSKDIDWRWYCHKLYLTNKKHDNPKFQNAWNKHGGNKFTFEIIEEVNDENLLLEREQYYLTSLKPYERNVGYNICPKAEGGDNITHNPNRDDFIKKMTIINTGESNGMYGKHHSNKTIENMKKKSVGRFTLDWFIVKYGTELGIIKFKERNEMLKNRKMNYVYDNGMKGKKRGPMSDEIKQRISKRKAKLKLIRDDLHKDILSNQYTMIQLSEKYGISMSTIKNQKKKVN